MTSTERHAFSFETYGVRVSILSNDAEILRGAEAVARRSLLNDIRPISDAPFEHVFEIDRIGADEYMLTQNGQELGASEGTLRLFKFFDSILRVSVGEYAVDRVFLHAGVVGWRGKAIVMPADSFQGKSTLTAELVRQGADYYSDDFAVIDADAHVHPFARRLSMRTDDFKTYELSVNELGGSAGVEPIPVGIILFTGYESGTEWTPIVETQGSGVLKLIPFTLSIRNRPEFSMGVLHKLTSRAIIISGLRGSAERFAKTLLDFVDKHVN